MDKAAFAKELNGFYKGMKHRFISYIDAPTFKISDIHKFRVSIKKIRIIFELFEMLSSNEFDAKENFDVLKSLFKASGKIREIQLILLRLGRCKLPRHAKLLYKQHLLKNELSLKRTLKRRIKKFDKSKLNKTSKKVHELMVRDACKLNNPELFFKYIKNHFQKIKKLRSTKEKEDTIHLIRKHFKAMHGVLKLMNKLKPNVQAKKSLAQFDEIELSIGKWHDRYVFINSLGLFCDSKKNKGSSTSFFKFKKELVRVNAIQLKSVYKKIDKFLSSFEINTKIEIQIK